MSGWRDRKILKCESDKSGLGSENKGELLKDFLAERLDKGNNVL